MLLLVAGFSLGSLLAGASYLGTLLPGGLPIGNVLAWLGLLSAAGAAFVIAPRSRPLRAVAAAALIASAAWLPASIMLSGNLALNFSGRLGMLWLTGSLVLLAIVLCLLLFASVSALVHRE